MSSSKLKHPNAIDFKDQAEFAPLISTGRSFQSLRALTANKARLNQ